MMAVPLNRIAKVSDNTTDIQIPVEPNSKGKINMLATSKTNLVKLSTALTTPLLREVKNAEVKALYPENRNEII